MFDIKKKKWMSNLLFKQTQWVPVLLFKALKINTFFLNFFVPGMTVTLNKRIVSKYKKHQKDTKKNINKKLKKGPHYQLFKFNTRIFS